MRKVVETVAAFETCSTFLKINVTPTMAASPAPRRRRSDDTRGITDWG
jgi:hypothetical protein